MAFDVNNLVLIAGQPNSNLGRHFSYQEAATVAAIAASGYFNAGTNILKKGDIISIFGSNGSAMAQVTSATGAATVTVGAFTALT